MRPFSSTISLDEARQRLSDAVSPIERTERVSLADAVGRVVAADVTSPMSVPPFSRSVMDGYAVVAADTHGASATSPARLRIVERVYTGQVPTKHVTRGACAEIATGAPMPAGADAVVMVEETRLSDDGCVDILKPAAAAQNITVQGADISPGDVVARRGDLVNASRLGALAAIGATDVDVFARPRVAVLSTGNEVIDPGAQLAPGQIYDVNRFTLSAVVTANGGIPDPRPPVEDTLEQLTRALDACSDADVIVFSGGSSVGERDLVMDLVAARGTMIFHGIAVKPGKPTAFARIRRAVRAKADTTSDVPFFGMPGNPTSCLSNAYILLVPYLRATARLPLYAPRIVRATLGKRIDSPAGRHQFYTVRLVDGVAFPAFKGSGAITSLSQADGYIEIPASQGTVEEGADVEVKIF